GRSPRVGLDVIPVVVGPHQREFQSLPIGGIQISLVERGVQEGAIVVVIPVKDKRIDAVVGGGVNLFGHHLRIGFIAVSPERDLWLIVPGETRLGIFDQFPFAPGCAFFFRVSRIAGVIVGKIVNRNLRTGGSGGLRQSFGGGS